MSSIVGEHGMPNNQVFSLQELSDFVVPLLRKYNLQSAKVFGSYARGEAQPDSDIDLIIEGGAGFRPLNVYALAEDLREASGKDVDAYEVSELQDGDLAQSILREAVPL